MAKRLANGLSQQKRPRLRKLHLMPARSFDYASTSFRLKTQFFPLGSAQDDGIVLRTPGSTLQKSQ